MKTEIIEFKDTDIYCPIENDEIYVAIKPICEALGIDFRSQLKRFKRDEMWGQLWSFMTTVGRDSKKREMACLPLKFVFDWIMTIDVGRVKEDVKDSLIAYKIECCEVLYDHFVETGKNINRKEELLNASERKIAEIEEQRKVLRKQLKEEKERFKRIALAPANQLDLCEKPKR